MPCISLFMKNAAGKIWTSSSAHVALGATTLSINALSCLFIATTIAFSRSATGPVNVGRGGKFLAPCAFAIPVNAIIATTKTRIDFFIHTPCSHELQPASEILQFNVSEPQCIRDDGNRAERHSGARNHGAEQQGSTQTVCNGSNCLSMAEPRHKPVID